jgi:hypothetical protein
VTLPGVANPDLGLVAVQDRPEAAQDRIRLVRDRPVLRDREVRAPLLVVAGEARVPFFSISGARRWHGNEEEQERLARERLHGQNLLVRPGRVLLPTHGGPNSVLAARILDLAWPEGTMVTVFSAGPDVPAADLQRVLGLIEKKPAEHIHSRDEVPLHAVLEQAAYGYGAIVVGASNERDEGRMVSPFVDGLMAASPVPVVMIRRGVMLDREDVPNFQRVLVPAIATLPGRA